MTHSAMPPHAALTASSRLRAATAVLGDSPLAGTAVLLLLGFASAYLAISVDFGVRIPGHAILRAVVPLALGLALVPRRHAGFVAGAGTLAGALALGGWQTMGPGALTSLSLTGPILDFAVRSARSGRGVYAGLVAGGLAANLLAFGVRLAAKLSGEVGRRPLSDWWPEAIVTYALCGAAAGLISATVWFRFREREDAARGAAA